MFLMALVLAGASCFMEYKLVKSAAWFRSFMMREHVMMFGRKVNTSIVPLMFSLLLSMVLGAMFGAAGMIVFVAGLVSTGIMQPYYASLRKGGIANWINSILPKDIAITMVALFKVVKFVFVCVRIPFKVIAWFLTKLS